MALQYSATLRSNQLDQIDVTIGSPAKLYIWSGTPPANVAAADSGTLLCTIDLPSPWMAAASNGSVAKTGAWSGTAGNNGTAGHFRIKDSTGTTCSMQGTVTATGGGGDMTLDNTTIATSQTVTISTFTISAGNA